MIDAVMGFIGQILYPLFSIIFVLIDILQAIFFAFAGIDDVTYDGTVIGSGNSGEVNDNGLIFYLLNSSIVKNVFYSIILLAIVLIIIFTVMAFLKNVYAEQPKSWKNILASAIKGLAHFFLIPVLCLLGVWFGNILLVAINGATSATNTMNLSRQLFITSAYNANKIRTGEMYGDTISEDEAKEIQSFCNGLVSVDLPSDPNGSTDLEYYASKIDEVYSMANGPGITWWGDVDRYYSLMDINYILLVGGGIFILYILVNISFLMVKRMFMILILFIISPAICAMYPLDDGAKVKSWKDSFIKQFLSAFSAVAAMNLFFCISPLIQNISIPGVNDLLGIIPLLLTIAGLYVVKDLITLINGFIGGDTPFDTGLASSVRNRINLKKNAQKVAKVAGGAFGAGAAAYKNSRARGEGKASSFFKGFLGGSAGNLGKQLNDSSKGWGLGLRGAASSAATEGEKAWKESHKSKVEEVEKAEKEKKEVAETEKGLVKSNAAMSGHGGEDTWRSARRAGFDNRAMAAALKEGLDTAKSSIGLDTSYLTATYTGSPAEQAAQRAAAAASATRVRDDAQAVVEGYKSTSAMDGYLDVESMRSLDRLFSKFEKAQDTSQIMAGVDARYTDRVKSGNKFTSAEIDAASAADKDAMINANSAIDRVSSLGEFARDLGRQLTDALESLKESTNNESLETVLDSRLDEIKTAIGNNQTTNTSYTEIRKILSESKDAMVKQANTELENANNMKKIAQAIQAMSKENGKKDS